MYASSLLQAMPRQVSVTHEGNTLTLRLHGDITVMEDGTLVRHWTDDSESVLLALFVTHDQEDYNPSRCIMMMASGGPVPEPVARQLHKAFFPDERVWPLQIPGVGGWALVGHAMLRNMGHRFVSPN